MSETNAAPDGASSNATTSSQPAETPTPSTKTSDEDLGGNARERREARRLLDLAAAEGIDHSKLSALLKADKDAAETKRKAEAERARKAQDWPTIEQDYQRQLKERDDKLAAYEQENAKREAEKRRGKLLDSVLGKAGLPANYRDRVDGLLDVAARKHGIEVAPESITDADITKVIKALETVDGETFRKKGVPSTNTPGAKTPSDISDKVEQVREAARRHGYGARAEQKRS